ncbi:MAG: glycerate kinase [Alphaproteobacteria bacterium]|nr:glycerate kinase [Alphaproteobacteria bacterium]
MTREPEAACNSTGSGSAVVSGGSGTKSSGRQFIATAGLWLSRSPSYSVGRKVAVLPAPRKPREFLRSLFDAALAASDPARVLPPHLPKPPKGRTIVVGAGKAAAAMAKTVEDHWRGEITGLVVTRYGYGVRCKRIEVVEASHPVPDAAGRAAAERILKNVQGLTRDDLVLCLISGGASALLALPAPGITLDDKRALTHQLLRCGASIFELNAVRKHLSAIKGGRLAAAVAPARIVTLAISDVPGDDPAVIGSGPTVPDPSTFGEARAILAKYAITPPPSIARHLEAAIDETPKPGDRRLAGARYVLIATPQAALQAAADAARKRGVTPIILGDAIEGEAREAALVHAGIARAVARGHFRIGNTVPRLPLVLLSGGETTVTVTHEGRGGRNSAFVLALALALKDARGIYGLACDTDGTDGTEDNAGAIVTPDTLTRAARQGIDLKALLAADDSWVAFNALDDLIVTGPTRTNVNDFRAILVLKEA